MKILIYQPRASYYIGGGEIVPINQAAYLIDSGIDVTFVTSKAPWLKESDAFIKFKDRFGKNIIQIDIPEYLKDIYEIEPGHDWKRWDLESVNFGLFAKSTIENINYDIAFCHLPLDLIALNPTKHNIVYLHGYPKVLNYACELMLYEQGDYIAVSERVRDEWLKLLGNKQIFTIHNGVDTTFFRPSQKIEKNIDILFVGRLIENKGIINLLPVFKKLTFQNSLIKIGVVGTGPLNNQIETYINDNGLSPNIELYGNVSEDRLLGLYQDTKIAVYPSISKEGILTTALEATSCGVPILCSKGLGLDVYIKDGENGLFINPHDENDIYTKIIELLSNQSILKNMSEKARLLSLDWDWTNKIKNLIDYIKKYE